MAFLYSPPNYKNKFQTSRERTISLGLQVILAMILTLVYHVMICVQKDLMLSLTFGLINEMQNTHDQFFGIYNIIF